MVGGQLDLRLIGHLHLFLAVPAFVKRYWDATRRDAPAMHALAPGGFASYPGKARATGLPDRMLGARIALRSFGAGIAAGGSARRAANDAGRLVHENCRGRSHHPVADGFRLLPIANPIPGRPSGARLSARRQAERAVRSAERGARQGLQIRDREASHPAKVRRPLAGRSFELDHADAEIWPLAGPSRGRSIIRGPPAKLQCPDFLSQFGPEPNF